MRQLALADEVLDLVLFLCSPARANYISGNEMVIGGGATMSGKEYI